MLEMTLTTWYHQRELNACWVESCGTTNKICIPLRKSIRPKGDTHSTIPWVRKMLVWLENRNKFRESNRWQMWLCVVSSTPMYSANNRDWLTSEEGRKNSRFRTLLYNLQSNGHGPSQTTSPLQRQDVSDASGLPAVRTRGYEFQSFFLQIKLSSWVGDAIQNLPSLSRVHTACNACNISPEHLKTLAFERYHSSPSFLLTSLLPPSRPHRRQSLHRLRFPCYPFLHLTLDHIDKPFRQVPYFILLLP